MDEMEVYRAIQDCLELRKSYIFREAVAPWEKEVISDPSTPKPIKNPFNYTLEGKSDVSLISKLSYTSSIFAPGFSIQYNYLIFIMNH